MRLVPTTPRPATPRRSEFVIVFSLRPAENLISSDFSRGRGSRKHGRFTRIVRRPISSSSFAPCAQRSARRAQACARIRVARPLRAGVGLRPPARALRAVVVLAGRSPPLRGERLHSPPLPPCAVPAQRRVLFGPRESPSAWPRARRPRGLPGHILNWREIFPPFPCAPWRQRPGGQ